MRSNSELDDRALLALVCKLEESGEYGASYPPIASHWQKDWTAPTEKPRPPNDIPADDEIERLLGRPSSPRIDLQRTNVLPVLRLYGPYRLMRSHLAHCSIPPEWINPDDEAQKRQFLTAYRDEIDNISDRLLKLLKVGPSQLARRQLLNERSGHSFDRLLAYEEYRREIGLECDDWLSPPPSHLWRALGHARQDVEKSLSHLRALRQIAVAELDMTVAVKPTGRRAIEWKKWFVGRMAHLWWLLTGEEASRDEHSMFAGFVQAAWNSLGPDMPEQSFANSIKTRPRQREAA